MPAVDRTRAGLAKTGRRNWRGTGNRLPFDYGQQQEGER